MRAASAPTNVSSTTSQIADRMRRRAVGGRTPGASAGAAVARRFPTPSVAGFALSSVTSLVTTAIAVPATTRQITNVDNLTPIVPGDPARPARRKIHPLWWLGTGVFFVLVAALVAALVIQVPYEIIAPGSVTPTNGRVQVSSGASTYAPTGEIDFVTVSVDSHVTVLEKFQADHDGDVEIEKQTVSPAQDTQVNTALMVQSKDTAVLVALQKLGYDLGSDGAQVLDVVKGMPADGVVQPGDTIVSIDAQPIKTTAQLRDVFGAHKPGDAVSLELLGNASPSPVAIASSE